MQTHTGGCHCGRVRFEITTDLSRASECNCSLCSFRLPDRGESPDFA